MNLIEIDLGDPESAQAVFHFGSDRVGAEHFLHLAAGVPAQAPLGENVGARARPSLESPGDDLFGMPQTVDGGGVDPVHAQFERAMNRGDGVVIVLMSPSELPAGTPNGPSPVTNWSDVQI